MHKSLDYVSDYELESARQLDAVYRGSPDPTSIGQSQRTYPTHMRLVDTHQIISTRSVFGKE